MFLLFSVHVCHKSHRLTYLRVTRTFSASDMLIRLVVSFLIKWDFKLSISSSNEPKLTRANAKNLSGFDLRSAWRVMNNPFSDRS